MRRVIAIVVALVVVIGLIFAAWRALPSRGVASDSGIETVPVERSSIMAAVSATGSIVAKAQVTLNFKSAGRVAEVRVEKGDLVEAGEVLAKLEAADLELQVAQAEAALAMNEAKLEQTKAGATASELAAAEANLASARADYEKIKAGPTQEEIIMAKADLERAEAALKQAQAAYDNVAWSPDIAALPQSVALEQATTDYQRALANYNLTVGHPTESELESAEAQLAQAQSQLDKLRNSPTAEELAIAQAQVDQARASLAEAKLRLAEATIVAPFAGTVASVGGEVGELVSSATPMIVLVDLSRFHIDVSIDETDIGQVQVGQPVSITLDAFPGQGLSGQVTRIDPLGTVTQGVVNYVVTIDIAPTDVPLKPDMTANADIVVAKKEGVLVVPNRAIRRDREGKYVEVLVNGQPQRVYITTGLSDGKFTEVVAGLEEGAPVITSAPRRDIFEEMGGPFGR